MKIPQPPPYKKDESEEFEKGTFEKGDSFRRSFLVSPQKKETTNEIKINFEQNFWGALQKQIRRARVLLSSFRDLIFAFG